MEAAPPMVTIRTGAGQPGILTDLAAALIPASRAATKEAIPSRPVSSHTCR